MKLLRQPVIGSRKTMAFVCPGGLREIDVPVYPPSPNGDALRDFRVELKVPLRLAAKALGLTALQLGEVERGICVFEEEADWIIARNIIKRCGGEQE